MCHDDLRPQITGRPAGRFAERVVPIFPGTVPPTFPADWLANLT
jgi:hypothetical protein